MGDKSSYLLFQGGAAALGAAYNYISSRTATSSLKRSRRVVRNMNEHFTQARGRYGRKRRLTTRALQKSVTMKLIERWQNVSKFGIGGGQNILYWRDNSVWITYPFHVMELTHTNNNPLTGTFNGLECMGWNVSGLELYHEKMPSQMPDGSRQVNGTWVTERGTPPTLIRNMMLRWVQIKLNLYGSLFRPLKYKLCLFQMDDDCCYGHTANSDPELKLKTEALLRPYLYNNLLGDMGEQKKGFRMLKQWHYTMDPVNKSDAHDADTTNYNPHFKEVKLWLPLDRMCNYDWFDEATTQNMSSFNPQIDTMQTSTFAFTNHVYPSKRLFFGIICSCGDNAQPNTPTTEWNSAATNESVKHYGSYDIVVRRCFNYNEAI